MSATSTPAYFGGFSSCRVINHYTHPPPKNRFDVKGLSCFLSNMKRYKALVARLAHEAVRALVSGETAVWQRRRLLLWPWPEPPPCRGAAPGAGGGQGGLACCGPRGCREVDMAERRSTSLPATAASGPQLPPASWLAWRRVGPPYEAEAPTPLHPAITWGRPVSLVTRLSDLSSSPWCVWACAHGSNWLG